MVGFGIFGFILRKLDIALVPVVLGLLLGSAMESNMRRALAISAGDPWIFVSSNISIGLYIATAFFLAAAIYMAIRNRPLIEAPRDDGGELTTD
jgi:putative tricarboxylic transport membrane protein